MVEWLTYSFGSFRVASVARMNVDEFCKKHGHIDLEILEDIWMKCVEIEEGGE
jgi:hypothetical protein